MRSRATCRHRLCGMTRATGRRRCWKRSAPIRSSRSRTSCSRCTTSGWAITSAPYRTSSVPTSCARSCRVPASSAWRPFTSATSLPIRTPPWPRCRGSWSPIPRSPTPPCPSSPMRRSGPVSGSARSMLRSPISIASPPASVPTWGIAAPRPPRGRSGARPWRIACMKPTRACGAARASHPTGPKLCCGCCDCTTGLVQRRSARSSRSGIAAPGCTSLAAASTRRRTPSPPCAPIPPCRTRGAAPQRRPHSRTPRLSAAGPTAPGRCWRLPTTPCP